MDGLLLVDKPAGLSSFDVVRRVRRIANIRGVGHTGTLDPDATGLLPIVLGRCTKLANYLVLDTKEYLFEMKLGQTTDSDDSTGHVLSECAWEHVSREALEAALAPFRGSIMQVPPIYSALKVEGKRAYELARKGEEVVLAARPVEVHSLELLDFTPPLARLVVQCGSGTYVRSLARDIGLAVGSCAHTTMIRRNAVGRFRVEEAHQLDELAPETLEAALRSPREMLASLTQYVADDAECTRLAYGQRIDVVGTAAVGDPVAVSNEGGELVALTIVEAIGGDGLLRLKPKRVMKQN